MIAKYNCVALFNVKVRPDPSTANSTNLQLLAGEAFQISEIVPDRLDTTNAAKKWGHIFGGQFDGKYTALEYPSNPVPISSYTLIDNTIPPVPSEKVKIISLTVTANYADGSTETNEFFPTL